MNCGHYTTQKGLLGMVSTERLWATNIKYLNDEHEFLDALSLIREIIPQSRITEDHRDYEIHKKYIKKLDRELNSLDNYVSESIFTFSFSEKTDLLSQWRGYCPDNKGYCLVFDIDEVHEEVNKLFDNSHLLKCVYDKSEKQKILKRLLNTYWEKYFHAESDKDRKPIIDELGKEVMLLASYFKHPSFSEEKEQRIVVIVDYAPDSDLKFREGKLSLIPYIELPISRKNIKGICIGPTSNKKLSERSLEIFLEKNYGMPVTWGLVNITHSKTPYRPW